MAKWTYILTFYLDDEMINEEFLKEFDKEVLGRIQEVAEKYGVKYKLLPTPHILIDLITKEREGRGNT